MSAHDVSKGGLAVSLSEMAVQGLKGFTVNLDHVPAKTSRIDHLLFSESRSRFIIESRSKNTPRILRMLKIAGIKAEKIGRVEGDRIEFLSKDKPVISIPVSSAREAWTGTLPKMMEAAA